MEHGNANDVKAGVSQKYDCYVFGIGCYGAIFYTGGIVRAGPTD